MNRKTLTVRLILLIVLFILLLLFAVGGIMAVYRNNADANPSLFGSFSLFNGKKSWGKEALVSTKEYNPENFDEIDISTASADIRMMPGGDKITVQYYSNSTAADEAKQLSIGENNRVLSIQCAEKSNFISSANRYIVINVPESSAYHYTLHTASGDINSTAPAKSGNFTTVSGDITLTGKSAESISATTTSGDISCNAKTPQLTLNTTSGDVKNLIPAQTIVANSVSGDLDIIADKDSQSIKINTVSGDSKLSLGDANSYAVNFTTTSGDTYDSISNRHAEKNADYTVGGGKLVITAHSVSGDMKIDR